MSGASGLPIFETSATALCGTTGIVNHRRKFEKSNFRQYGQMKSRDGKRQREEKSRREADQRRESLGRKKIQVREKVGKSGNTVCFPMMAR